jgi:hypothetical protein
MNKKSDNCTYNRTDGKRGCAYEDRECKCFAASYSKSDNCENDNWCGKDNRDGIDCIKDEEEK